MSEYRYTVDALDVIRSVSDEWDRFASENGAANLCKESSLGNALWDFVADLETRHLYQTMFAAVRSSGRTITVPFRCDGPDRRRFMRLTIRLLPQQWLDLLSEIIREESRAPVALLDATVPRTDTLLTMCGWCKRVNVEGNRWLEVEEAVEILHLFDRPELPGISHGVCPSCGELITASIESESD